MKIVTRLRHLIGFGVFALSGKVYVNIMTMNEPFVVPTTIWDIIYNHYSSRHMSVSHFKKSDRVVCRCIGERYEKKIS